MKAIPNKTRLEIALPREEKELIEAQADSIGVSTSEFVRLMCVPERRHEVEGVNARVKELCARRAAS